MSLVSRALEAAGISTVIVGSARDVVEHCGVARFLFVDFPLGNPCGKPYDRAMQRAIAGMALDMLEQCTEPRSTRQAPFEWDDDAWRARFMQVTDANRAALAAAGEERRQQQAEDKTPGAV